MRQFRTREIKRLYKSGRSVAELMEIFGVSDRTVYRAIKTAGRKTRKGAD
jgi:predicted DNA-binding transcriptional regulator YafY